MEKRNINLFNVLLRVGCLLLPVCLSLPAHAAGTEGTPAAGIAPVLGPVMLLLWLASLVAIAVLSVFLYRCRCKLRRCHEYMLRYISENMELKKHVPASKRPYAFAPPEITPEEFIKIIDNMLKKIMFLPLLLLPFLPVKAQEKADSLYEFRFVAEKDMFYVPYGNNRAELERLKALIRQNREAIASGGVPIRVDGYCNSLSGEAENLSVARTRSNRVKSELIVQEKIKEACFITRNHATLGDLVTVSIYIPGTATKEAENPRPRKEDKVQTASTPVRDTATEKNTDEMAQNEPSATDETVVPTPGNGKKEYGTLALRANLLRWATLTPDLGVEWRVSRSVGILVGGSWTSWSWDNKNRRYALWRISPEVRYYIGKEKRGYLGAMYHVGEFNYKLGDTGRQGDYQGGGITGGWQLPLNRALSLDFHAALGYTRADYDKYDVTDGVRVRQGSDSKNYWGVNQVGVTLVWKFVK